MREGWTYKKLGEVCNVTMGQSPNGNSVNTSNGMEFHQGKIFFGEKYLNVSNIYTEQPSKIAAPDSVLLCVRAPVGIVNITPRRICIGRGLCAIQPNDIIIMPFLFYVLTKRQAYYNKNSTGSTFKAISSKVVISTEIPVPPLSEQERIVSELDLLTSIINKQKAQLKELDSLAQSIFYDMFGDPIVNPKGWEVIPLNSVGQIARGVSKHRPRNAPELLGSFIPLIQTGDVANSGMYIMESQYGYSKLGMEQSKVWPSGTLCITIAANIGKCSIMTFDACFPDSVVGFTPTPDCTLVVYAYFFFKSTQKAPEGNPLGVAQKNINLKILNDMKIPLPPLSLQQSFASKIEAIEAQKALITKSMEETQRLFDSRMDYWFA